MYYQFTLPQPWYRIIRNWFQLLLLVILSSIVFFPSPANLPHIPFRKIGVVENDIANWLLAAFCFGIVAILLSYVIAAFLYFDDNVLKAPHRIVLLIPIMLCIAGLQGLPLWPFSVLIWVLAGICLTVAFRLERFCHIIIEEETIEVIHSRKTSVKHSRKTSVEILRKDYLEIRSVEGGAQLLCQDTEAIDLSCQISSDQVNWLKERLKIIVNEG